MAARKLAERAAKELGCCRTLLKRRCRELGIRRWPGRKMKCVQRSLQLVAEWAAGVVPGDNRTLNLHLENFQDELNKKKEELLENPDAECERPPTSLLSSCSRSISRLHAHAPHACLKTRSNLTQHPSTACRPLAARS